MIDLRATSHSCGFAAGHCLDGARTSGTWKLLGRGWRVLQARAFDSANDLNRPRTSRDSFLSMPGTNLAISFIGPECSNSVWYTSQVPPWGLERRYYDNLNAAAAA